MMIKIKLTIVILIVLASTSLLTAQEHHSMNGEASIEKLTEGNGRYVSGNTIHPNQDDGRRGEVAGGQNPFAVIVGCADSRVPPEILFDQGLGDLFVIRIAGNIVDDIGIGSIEYAVEHLGTPLVVVLGHERCGAVGAAVKGGEIPGHIKAIVDQIQPAVDKAKALDGDVTENAIKFNVEAVVEKLKASTPIISHLIEEGHLTIVGARYDLDDGKVTFYK